MKTKFTFSLFLVFSVSVFLFVGCKSTKVTTNKEVGRILEDIPCDKEGVSDKNYFRASAIATSNDLSLSKEKALLLAKQRVSTLISTRIKGVTERYVNETEVQNQGDFEQKFENLTREVIDLQMNDITIICNKSSVLDDGRYRSFCAIEISKEEFYNGIDKGLSNDKKVQVDYDKMKFEKIYKEEMEKIETERNSQ